MPRAVGVEVRAVAGAQGSEARSSTCPFRLHANHPLWVPPLKLERRLFLNRRMNAFFSHGEAEYFLARRDGRVVGRISAQVNHAFNDYQEKNWGWFGFLEFEDDPEVLRRRCSTRPRRGCASAARSGWSARRASR